MDLLDQTHMSELSEVMDAFCKENGFFAWYAANWFICACYCALVSVIELLHSCFGDQCCTLSFLFALTHLSCSVVVVVDMLSLVFFFFSCVQAVHVCKGRCQPECGIHTAHTSALGLGDRSSSVRQVFFGSFIVCAILCFVCELQIPLQNVMPLFLYV